MCIHDSNEMKTHSTQQFPKEFFKGEKKYRHSIGTITMASVFPKLYGSNFVYSLIATTSTPQKFGVYINMPVFFMIMIINFQHPQPVKKAGR